MLDFFKRFLPKTQEPPTPQRRSLDMAKTSRLNEGWSGAYGGPNMSLRASLATVRNRSRQLAANEPHVRKFVRLLEENVIGSGVGLQMRVMDPNGQEDATANAVIERAWKDFSRPKECTLDGFLGLTETSRQLVGSMAVDGEVFVILHPGHDNRHGLALQVVEADQLDETLNQEGLPGGRRIVLGVELDANGRRLAYHFFKRHPGETGPAAGGRERVRIPAEQVLHLFVQERPGQVRGLPWLTPVGTRLHMLAGYEEAELVAARTSASKMGFFKEVEGDYKGDGENEDGDFYEEAEPGMFGKLPGGVDFVPFDPQHPTSAFKDFHKSVMRGVSSGLGVSYTSLSSDLEGVNFSSIRQGVLEEREFYKRVQALMIDHVLQPLFGAWLPEAILSRTVPLPFAKLEKFRAATWQGRRWGWVDPLKDIEAAERAVRLGVKSRSMIAAETGVDLDEIFKQLEAEKRKAAKLEINIMPKEATNNDQDARA